MQSGHESHPAGRGRLITLVCTWCRDEMAVPASILLVHRNQASGDWEFALTTPCCDREAEYPVPDGWEGALALRRLGARMLGDEANIVADIRAMEALTSLDCEVLCVAWSALDARPAPVEG